MFSTGGKGLIKINNNSNVEYMLQKNKKYYMYLPATKELLYLSCSGVAIRAADMKILKHIKDGKNITDDLNCTFGYQFEHYDSVHFASFSYREKCEIYSEENIYILQHPDETLLSNDQEE